jgi:hypothetical protein
MIHVIAFALGICYGEHERLGLMCQGIQALLRCLRIGQHHRDVAHFLSGIVGISGIQ